MGADHAPASTTIAPPVLTLALRVAAHIGIDLYRPSRPEAVGDMFVLRPGSYLWVAGLVVAMAAGVADAAMRATTAEVASE